MKRKFMPALLLLVFSIYLLLYVVEQGMTPAYMMMGSGLFVIMGLTLYVIQQIRQSIRNYLKEPAK